MSDPAPPATALSPLERRLGRVIEIEPGEGRVLLQATACIFFLFASYAILKPMRDAVGADQIAVLPRLYQATTVATLFAAPAVAFLFSWLKRALFVPVLFRFLALNLVGFAVLLATASGGTHAWAERAFYVWVSVFNLLVVAIFWGMVADRFRPEQGLRLFAFIGVGNTLGSIAGAALASALAERIGVAPLLWIAIVLLEVSVWFAKPVRQANGADGAGLPSGELPSFRDAFEGMTRVLRSPYLLGICAFMFLYTFTSSFVRLQKAALVKAAFDDPAASVAFFANVDIAIQVATLVIQVLATGRFLRFAGIGAGLALVPALTILGFALLGTVPTLALLVGFEIARSSLNYAVARPCREILYTAVDRVEKYKSKSFIDTFVYRGGDAAAAEAFARLTKRLELGTSGLAFAAIPFAVAWLAVGWMLGRSQRRRVRAAAAAAAEPATP